MISESPKTSKVKVSHFSIASNLYYLEIEGNETEPDYSANEIVKNILKKSKNKPKDTHFIVNAHRVTALPKHPIDVVDPMSFLTDKKTGEMVLMIDTENKTQSKFMDFLAAITRRLFDISLTIVHSPEEAVETLEKKIPGDNKLWQETTPKKILAIIKKADASK